MLDWSAHPTDTRLNWNTHAHGYQKAGAAHLFQNRAATLWLDPGYGKTMITLHAFKALLDMELAETMLVVAPKRVMQTVWAQEIGNWSSLQGLVAQRLHGPKKEKMLQRTDVNVWVINYEGLPWLAKMAKDGKIPFKFDVITFDEIRRLKNATGKRFKAVRPLAAMAGWVWGATGTPSANGLLDLFGQFLIIDGGEALGTRITKYRQDYFELGFDGFTWLPRPGAREAIEQRIGHMVYRAEGMVDMPEMIEDHRTVVLEKDARAKYDALKKDLVAEIGEGELLTAANAAVLYGKLKQMAHGRVYDADGGVVFVHDAKKEAFEELVDELGDEQLLIGIAYKHDLIQIREVLGDKVRSFQDCKTTAKTEELERAWNAKEVQYIADHPESIGHGLNLQKGGAHHVLWWGPTIDLDHFIQFIQRLMRQGNPCPHVVVHTFFAEGTVDAHAEEARNGKDSLQGALLSALTAEVGDSIQIVKETKTGETDMTDLVFKSDAQATAQQPAPAQNPFAQNAAPAPQAAPAQNPFAQGAAAPAPQAAPAQPAQEAPANPFAQGGAAPAPQPAQTAPANPFAQGGAAPAPQPVQTPVQQQQAIQQEVAANPPATPQQAPNPFAPQGGAPVEDAQVVSETPAPNISASPEDRQPPATDTGWTTPANSEPTPASGGTAAVAGAAAVSGAATAPGEGLVPVFVYVPADKLVGVLRGIANAVNK